MFAVGAMFIGLVAVSPLFGTLSYDSIFFVFFLLFGILWSGCSYSIAGVWGARGQTRDRVTVHRADR